MFDDIADDMDRKIRELANIDNLDDDIDEESMKSKDYISLDAMKEDIKSQILDWYLRIDTREARYSLRSFIIGYVGSLRHIELGYDTKQKVKVKIMKVGK